MSDIVSYCPFPMISTPIAYHLIDSTFPVIDNISIHIKSPLKIEWIIFVIYALMNIISNFSNGIL